MTMHELTSKVEELKELKAMAEELSAEMATLEDAIKAEMAAREAEELQAGLFKVRYKTVESRRLDGRNAGTVREIQQGSCYPAFRDCVKRPPRQNTPTEGQFEKCNFIVSPRRGSGKRGKGLRG